MGVTQNIYSPNQFSLTFLHDYFWDFNKILNVNTWFFQDMIFYLFWLTLVSFFSKLCETFFCQHWMITVIIINVKSLRKRHFLGDLSKQCLKINLLLWKKSVPHTTTPLNCKARHVLLDLFSINQGNGSEMTFVAVTTKVNLKNLKSYPWLNDLMQVTIWRH